MFANGLDELLLVLSTRYDKRSKILTVISKKHPRIALDVVQHKIVDLKHLEFFLGGGEDLLYLSFSFST